MTPMVYLDLIKALWSELRGDIESACQVFTLIDLPLDSWHRLQDKLSRGWWGKRVTGAAAKCDCLWPDRFGATRTQFQLPVTARRTDGHPSKPVINSWLIKFSEVRKCLSCVTTVSAHHTFPDYSWRSECILGLITVCLAHILSWFLLKEELQ